MCCFITALLLVGPRFATIVWWLIDSTRFTAALDGFLIPCLGLIFLPWTLLAYLVAWQPEIGIQGFGWVVVGLGFLVDLSAYSGGYGNRRRISGYTRRS